MIEFTQLEMQALTSILFDQDVIDAWTLDLQLLAEDCLEAIEEPKKTAALKYLLAHFLTLQGVDGNGIRTSESMGDASWSFAQAHKGSGSKATTYGTLALRLAPCLGSLMGDKQYGGARLIR